MPETEFDQIETCPSLCVEQSKSALPVNFDTDPFEAYEAGVRMGWTLAEAHHGLTTPTEGSGRVRAGDQRDEQIARIERIDLLRDADRARGPR